MTNPAPTPCPNSSHIPPGLVDADGWCEEHGWDCADYSIHQEHAPTTTPYVLATVTLTVHPRQGQSPEAAAADMATKFRNHTTRHDFPLWEDYGATLADIHASHEDGETPGWGGYEGPFITDVAVSVSTHVHHEPPSETMTSIHIREFQEAAAQAHQAAQGDSNDDEIAALQDAVRSAAHALNLPDPF